MDDDEQARRSGLAERKQHGAQQRSGRQLQAGLSIGTEAFDECGLLRLGDGRQVDEGKGHLVIRRSNLLVPQAVETGEAQAQGIVVEQQMSEGQMQAEGIKMWRQGEQEGLIPVMRIGRVEFEEPGLDGGERDRTRDGELRSKGRGGELSDGGEFGDGLKLKELSGGDADAGLIGSGDDLDAEDGIAAEFEKVVVYPHLLKP